MVEFCFIFNLHCSLHQSRYQLGGRLVFEQKIQTDRFFFVVNRVDSPWSNPKLSKK